MSFVWALFSIVFSWAAMRYAAPWPLAVVAMLIGYWALLCVLLIDGRPR